MGSVVGERFVQGVNTARASLPDGVFFCQRRRAYAGVFVPH